MCCCCSRRFSVVSVRPYSGKCNQGGEENVLDYRNWSKEASRRKKIDFCPRWPDKKVVRVSLQWPTLFINQATRGVKLIDDALNKHLASVVVVVVVVVLVVVVVAVFDSADFERSRYPRFNSRFQRGRHQLTPFWPPSSDEGFVFVLGLPRPKQTQNNKF